MTDPDRRLVLATAACAALAAMLPTAARAAGDRLAPETMRRDIDVLYDAYTSLHPGLYRYLTPAAFLQQRRRLEAFARTPRSLGDFYLALSAFTASIRCGHSFPTRRTRAPRSPRCCSTASTGCPSPLHGWTGG